jgi:hypothetical protein
MHTFHGLRREEVMGHELDAFDRTRLLDGLWQILQDDAAGKIWILGLQSSALVSEATSDVDEMSTLWLERCGFLREWCNVEPVAFAGNAHQTLEPPELFGIL